jgi:hypothetical protein
MSISTIISDVGGGLLFWESVSRLLVSSKLFLPAPSQVAAIQLWTSSVEFFAGYIGVSLVGHPDGFSHGELSPRQTSDAAMGVRILCHAYRRFGAAFHPMVWHRLVP